MNNNIHASSVAYIHECNQYSCQIISPAVAFILMVLPISSKNEHVKRDQSGNKEECEIFS